jgi:hypothetical protein
MNTTELIDLYCQAWSESDADRRAELLARVWATGATYTDPTVHVTGTQALLEHIAKVMARRPGSKVVRTSSVDQHHNLCRFAWRAIESNGNLLPEGLDLAVLSADGLKIEKIVGFFGPLAEREK